MDNGDLAKLVLKNKRVAVTGGAGFIGSHLVDYLYKKGCCIKTVDINARRETTLSPDRVTEIIGDITRQEIIERLLTDTDIVFHLAGLVTQKNAAPDDYWKVNVDATRRLLEESTKQKVQRFIYCSSDSVSGKIKHLPAKESDPCFPDNIYGMTKYAAEKEVLKFEKLLQVVIVRPTRVYGPRDMRMLKIFRQIKKKRFYLVGNGEVLIHPVFVTDILNGLERCVLKDNISGQIFYLGGEQTLCLREFLKTIAAYFKINLPGFIVPSSIATLGVISYEAICKMLRVKPLFSQRNLEFFTRNRAYDISKAKRVLGYSPQVGIVEGVRFSGDWYKAKGYLG
ncbi:MAG: NAD-dependent epimerase/dehydratase family protein [Desulfobacterales bacterium]